ncbi:5-oxoprolinase subunit PxpB [Bacillus pinisoli]|uniref:5-oxoprolinase subunit PxpB n=1 Tax=Bacillus pinisoli TaxID=2901866 RepID=UPI001FF45EF8|nr:5-oxoprolinase subunit PxpB [Bacillus pinisoli]
MYTYTIQPISDDAILIQFSEEQEELLTYIHTFTQHLLNRKVAGIRDIVPAFTSIAVYYDPIQLTYQDLLSQLRSSLQEQELHITRETTHVEVPICYDPEFGFDLEDIAKQHHLSIEEVITIHRKSVYTVAIMGFLPGFPYMTGLPERIWTPRKATPRTHVPKGAVGIGGSYTGIYSLPSPGGWNIIGQTPLTLFDRSKDNPFVFQPGDQVTFFPITKKEFEQLSRGGQS